MSVWNDRNAVLIDAARRGVAYWNGLESRGVAASPEAVANLGALGGALPDHPQDPLAVLALLDDYGSPATVLSAGGRYFGLVIGGALPAAVGANVLAAAWDRNAGMRVMSPVASA